MTVIMTQELYDQFFPDMMNIPVKTANDNTYEKGLADMAGHPPDETEPQTWPDVIQKAIEAHQEIMQGMAEVIDEQSEIIECQEARIQNLEEILGE